MAGGGQGAFSGAVTGAGVGAVGGPIGAGIGAGLGGVLGLTTNLFGDGGESRDKLIAKQKQIAEEARKRQEEQHAARMQALGQNMLAFAPRNAAMAQMYGPQAAFSGQQIADMTADPNGPPKSGDPMVEGMMKRFPGIENMDYREVRDKHLASSEQFGKILDYARQKREWEEKEKARRAGVAANFPDVAGPTLNAPTQAAPARRF